MCRGLRVLSGRLGVVVELCVLPCGLMIRLGVVMRLSVVTALWCEVPAISTPITRIRPRSTDILFVVVVVICVSPDGPIHGTVRG